jgi:alpha-beta hydrolase superfamily lysophospholipase/predicted ester cyclase
MAHGLTGTRRDRLNAFADRFAGAGITALVFDYRGFGDSTGEPDLFDPARQLEDWRAAIDFARSLPDVDPERVATFGSSLGGGNALAAAAEDSRIAAVISQVPFLDRDSQTYEKPAHVVEALKAAARENRYLPAVGQPDEPALISAPGAEIGWRRVVAIGDESRWRNRVSSAWLLGPAYSPIQYASTLHCPWLLCIAADDQVAKPGPAIDAGRRAPKGEVRVYPGVDHFDIYDGPPHEAVVADEIEFLTRHLLGRKVCGTTNASAKLSRVHVSPSGESSADGRSAGDAGAGGPRGQTETNKAIVTRWFTEYWYNLDPSIVDELAAEDLVFSYPLHGELHGREPVKQTILELREAFPDMSFDVVGDLIAEGEYVVGRWKGGGTHTGPAFSKLPLGALQAASGKRISFSGTTIYRVVNGKVTEEIGQEQALNVLQQLGVVASAPSPASTRPE